MRLIYAILFVALGAIVVGRGILEAAPWTFTALGVALLALGLSQLRGRWGVRRRP